VPIDACYELAGRMRLHWRGFDGGAEARQAIAGFLDTVRRRAVPVDRGDLTVAELAFDCTGARPDKFALAAVDVAEPEDRRNHRAADRRDRAALSDQDRASQAPLYWRPRRSA